ncbi:MAG: ABC transporter ATP-binding protein [Rhodothalassiaceae bacterium]
MKLEAQALGISLDEARVVADATMALAAGEFVALVGPNGAGKSTLLRALAGLLPPAAGRVLLEGRDLATIPLAARARAIALLPQAAPVHWPIRVERLVALGRLPHLDAFHRPTGADRDAVARAMAATRVTHLAARPATHLSAGERARVLLARVLATGAPVLLADEPVAALDPYHQLQVMELLAAEAARGRAVLVVLHDLGLASRFCPRTLLMHRGRILADGPTDAVLSDDRLAATYGIRVSRGDGGLVPVARVEEGDQTP